MSLAVGTVKHCNLRVRHSIEESNLSNTCGIEIKRQHLFGIEPLALFPHLLLLLLKQKQEQAILQPDIQLLGMKLKQELAYFELHRPSIRLSAFALAYLLISFFSTFST